MSMSLNDRVALILGRAIIRAEELTVMLEQARAEQEAAKQASEPQPDTVPGAASPAGHG